MLLLCSAFPARPIFAATPPPPFVALPSIPGGEIVASIKFDPRVHGFAFENYGNDSHDWENDLTTADLIRMFGAENVCHDGSTPEDCVLTAAAREWKIAQLKGMDGGHCEGMAVASLRLFTSKPFRGKRTPGDFQKGAKTAQDLKREAVLNVIAYFHAIQTLDEVFEVGTGAADTVPSRVVQRLIEVFRDGEDLPTIWVYQNAEREGGHAMTPFAVEAVDDRHYRIHIYDNNYPCATQYMDVDTGSETWTYKTTTKPGEPEMVYVGDASTQSMGITGLSARTPRHKHFKAPFAVDEESEGDDSEESWLPYRHKALRVSLKHPLKPALEGEEVSFFMDGEGDFNITDGQGRCVGYDFDAKQARREIPNADIIPFMGGLGRHIPPTIVMPYDGTAKKPYVITVSGKRLKQESNADLLYAGPGFVVGFEKLRLDPGERQVIEARPDGREVTCAADADGEIPVVSFAFDPTKHGVSYIIELTAEDMSAGGKLTVTFDPESGKLMFRSSKTKKGLFYVRLTRINAGGREDAYETEAELGAAAVYMMDFSRWDGESDVPFYTAASGSSFGGDGKTFPRKSPQR
ncbi:MAG: hypothetical protein CFK52_02615 [Chloracidobacterium sp. CP2_5A]|nr:MAG: hypothetical protein CFK52_02615 [Chloracidobacterium sp. CP2_5A]